MTFDADAYAEGICNSAAGSTIETLVDTIDETIAALELLDDTDDVHGHWLELRDAIVEREKALGEPTTFKERK